MWNLETVEKCAVTKSLPLTPINKRLSLNDVTCAVSK